MPKDRPAPSSRRGFLRAGLVTTVATAVYPALGPARTAEQAAADAPQAPRN